MHSVASQDRGQMSPLDNSARLAIGNHDPKAVWFLVVDKATTALELDPDKSQQLAEEMNLLNQPDDPLELQDLEDLREVIVGMDPVKAINLFHYANPKFNLKTVPEQKPLETLKAVMSLFQSDRWAMQQ